MPDSPEGYQFIGPGLVNKDFPAERFVPTNRGFSEVDTNLKGLPSIVIRNLIRFHSIPLRVLDVAGGPRSVLTQDLAHHTEFGNSVDVTNVDILAKDEDFSSNSRARWGNALNLQFPDNSFDLILASEFIQWLAQDNSYQRPTQAYKEIARVLAPGGVAIAPSITLYNLLKDPRYDIPGILAAYGTEVLSLYESRNLLVKSIPDQLRDLFLAWHPS